MVTYCDSLTGITSDRLQGFFVGWPDPPLPAPHLRILAGSDNVVLALDGVAGPVVGFVTVISDGTSCAYVPTVYHADTRPSSCCTTTPATAASTVWLSMPTVNDQVCGHRVRLWLALRAPCIAYVARITRLRSRSRLARPYIWRFTSVMRVTCPSTWPLLRS